MAKELTSYFSGASCIVNGTTCCGLREIHNIPCDGPASVKKFIDRLSNWAEQYDKKDQHKAGFFTQVKDSELYRQIKKTKPSGIKIVHIWINSNTGNELFMAIVSPVYNNKRKKSAVTK